MSILVYSIRRLLAMIPLIIGISIMIFTLFAFMPADPVATKIKLTIDGDPEAQRRYWINKFGLDKPVWERYLDWFVPIITDFDFGNSWTTGTPVITEITPYIEKTVILFGISFFVGLVLSTILGVVAAVTRGSFFDQATLLASLIGFSMPSFVLGLLIIIAILALTNNTVIAIYDGSIHKSIADYAHVILAALITMTIGGSAFYIRLMRSQMLNILNQNYIKTARAKGLPERVVIYKHALRNAILPFVTIITLGLPSILSGSAIIEQVFNYPGVGRRLIRAVWEFDFPIILAVNMFFGSMSIFLLLVAEIMYGIVDPRIKF